MSNPALPSRTHTHVVDDIRNYERNATSAPTQTDDSTQAFEPASLWAIPSQNEMFVCSDSTAALAKWFPTSSTINSWIVSDTRIGGGGAVTLYNTWVTRTLQTITGSSSTNCTLAGDTITLQPGYTYVLYARAPMGRSPASGATDWLRHRIRLLDVTGGGSSVIVLGSCVSTPAYSGSGDLRGGQSQSTAIARVQVSITPMQIQVQHIMTTGDASTANCTYGGASGADPQVYTCVTVVQAN